MLNGLGVSVLIVVGNRKPQYLKIFLHFTIREQHHHLIVLKGWRSRSCRSKSGLMKLRWTDLVGLSFIHIQGQL